jgi:phosphatidylglycerophosphate synthase
VSLWIRRVLAVPNWLTLVRVPLALLLWLRPNSEVWLLSIIAVAALSDVVDGRVAMLLRRRANDRYNAEDHAVGAWLDPLCDKLFALSALGALWVGFDAPWAVIALTVVREVMIAPLVIAYHLVPSVRDTLRFDFRADWLGKVTTALQFAVVAAIVVVQEMALPLAIAAACFGVGSVAHYVCRGIAVARAGSALAHRVQPSGASRRR